MLVRDVLTRAGGLPLLAGLALIVTTFGPARDVRAQQWGPVKVLDRTPRLSLRPADPDEKDKAPQGQREEPADDKKTSLADLAQALLNSTERPSEAMVKAFLDGMEDTIQTGRKSGNPALREAVATLAGEFAANVRGGFLGTLNVNPLAIAVFPGLTKELTALGKDDTSPGVRAAAARALAEIPSAADPAVERLERQLEAKLTERLTSTDEDERKAAARDLPKLRATGELENLLTDKDPDVSQAAKNLSKLRDTVKMTAAALGNRLTTDKDAAVRRAVAEALTVVLQGTPPAEGGTAAAQVAKPSGYNLILCGPAVAKAAGAVLGGGNPDPEVRRRCAGALAQLGRILIDQAPRQRTDVLPGSSDRVNDVISDLWGQAKALATATRDPDPGVRRAALEALDEMGEVRRRQLHPEEFREPDRPTPRDGLPTKPRKAEAASPDEAGGFSLTVATEQAVSDKEWPPPLTAVIDDLVGALGDPDPGTRLGAVQALENVAPHGADRTAERKIDKRQTAEVAKGLTRSLYDRNRFVRWAAARTLGKLAPLDDAENGKLVQQAAVAGLARLLSDGNPDVRLWVAYALARFGKAAGAAVPALAVAASRGDEEARIAATHAIQVIGGSPDAAVPALAAGLDSTNVRLRRAVAEALSSYGPKARAAQPALQQALRDPDPDVRRLVSSALIRIGTGK